MKHFIRHRSRKLLLALVALAALGGLAKVRAQSGDGYDLSWYSIDGGSGSFAGIGGYEVSGIVGQPDPSVSMGGTYFMAGGFWAMESSGSSAIFSDGFESGNLTAWSAAGGAKNLSN